MTDLPLPRTVISVEPEEPQTILLSRVHYARSAHKATNTSPQCQTIPPNACSTAEVGAEEAADPSVGTVAAVRIMGLSLRARPRLFAPLAPSKLGARAIFLPSGGRGVCAADRISEQLNEPCPSRRRPKELTDMPRCSDPKSARVYPRTIEGRHARQQRWTKCLSSAAQSRARWRLVASGATLPRCGWTKIWQG